MDSKEAISNLKSKASRSVLLGMAKFGINTSDAIGVSIPQIRKIGKEIGTNHPLAQSLWKSNIKEARMLASLIDNPTLVTDAQMESWVKDFNSWDICDQCCGNLFDRTKLAQIKALEWSERDEEFVKRAGFVLMAGLAVHDKKSGDDLFLSFIPIIERECEDDRNFVKKAVNWALRQIGKRNLRLNKLAIESAQRMRLIDSSAARWIASNALSELQSDGVKRRLNGKA